MIEDLRPRTPSPGHFAKAVVGEAVRVRAVVFKEGHDVLAGQVRLVPKGRRQSESVAPLVPLGNDEWEAIIVPRQMGPYAFVVEAWTDRHATWAHKVLVKLQAGQAVDVEILEGQQLLERARAHPAVAAALDALLDPALEYGDRLIAALTPEVAAALRGPDGALDVTASSRQPLWVDRELALFGAWYELFPRSFGGFKGTAARVPDVAAMGFDVLYLPPIHPIGHTARKGPNNTLAAGAGDPGSPWAIGSHEGGPHRHPPGPGHRRGLLESGRRGASPRHGAGPRLRPAVFTGPPLGGRASRVVPSPARRHHRLRREPAQGVPGHLPDQLLAGEGTRPGGPVGRLQGDPATTGSPTGSRMFRVDNPHTKPIAFWEWLISSIQR